MQRYSLLLEHLPHTLAPGDGFLIAGVSETAPRCVLARHQDHFFRYCRSWTWREASLAVFLVQTVILVILYLGVRL